MASPGSTDRPTLVLVIDRSVVRGDLGASVEAAVRGGVDRVQLRDRSLEGAAWLAHADAVVTAARRGRDDVQISVNRRIDVALCLGLGAVHLGFDAVDIATARGLLGDDAHVGVSAHDVAQVRAAHEAGADVVHLAPIRTPRSKAATRPALGLAVLREAAASGARVIAQGGIGPEDCAQIVAAGAAGIAVTGAILMTADPEAAARALRAALDA